LIGVASEVRRWVRAIAAMRRSPKAQEPERGWIVQVRARANDPFGKVLYAENAAGFPEARDRAEALGRELRAGTRPWDASEEARSGG
jgi:hypothetical protein